MIGGPMFAGKSSKLTYRCDEEKYAKKNVLIVKPMIDDRYSKDCIETHTGVKRKAVVVNKLEDLENMEEYKKARVVGVDEAQFHFLINDEIRQQMINEIYRILPVDSDRSIDKNDISSIIDYMIKWEHPSITWILKQNKHFIMAGLDAGYGCRKFGHYLDLIPHSHSFVKMLSRCFYSGKKAPFTKLIDSESSSQVNIGGSEKYIAVSRNYI